MRKNVLILQARLGSERLPGKVLMPVLNKPLIGHQIERILKSKLLNKAIVAVPEGGQDDKLASYIESIGIQIIRGSMNNVQDRFAKALSNIEAEVVIRSTADCPLFMPELLDEMLIEFDSNREVDYLSNTIVPTFPDGLDIEIFTREAFQKLVQSEQTPAHLEHVTLGFYDGSHDFKIKNFYNTTDLSAERWTVDYSEDFEFVKRVFEELGTTCTMQQVLDYVRSKPQNQNKKSSAFRNIALKKDRLN